MIYALIEREAPRAVIFRRGASKQVLLLSWNLETDEIVPGQWFKGHVYERRSDLSPDGKYLLYFAGKHRGQDWTWTALSEPPAFTAIARWPNEDTYGGGGLFDSATRIALNHGAEESALAAGSERPPAVEVHPIAKWAGGGEDEPIWLVRLRAKIVDLTNSSRAGCRIYGPMAIQSLFEPTLQIDKTLRRGDRGEFVTRVQEWLCFHQFNVGIDGAFGPATEQGVADFQAASGLAVTGAVDPSLFALLAKPMADAVRPLAAGATLGQTIAACAQQHLLLHPVEIGGQNRGPWVRLYLRGLERPKDPKLPQGFDAWCAGFATSIVDQAATAMHAPAPLGYHTNCNLLAKAAQKEKRFRRGGDVKPHDIPPGSLMLIRKRGQRDKWHHTGVVIEALPQVVRTIEGNSANSAEENPSGHEVCRQLRPYGNLDFIVIE